MKLYINGQLCDLGNALPLINIGVEGNGDVRLGLSVRQFTIDATHRNTQALGFPYDLTNGSYAIKRLVDVALETDDGESVFDGQGRLVNVQGNISRPLKYTLKLLGGNKSWAELMANRSLRDLELGTFTHEYGQAITNSALGSVGVLYILTNYGEWERGTEVLLSEMRPSVRISRIVQACFNEAGYSVVSSFISSSQFEQLFYAFSSGLFNADEDYLLDNFYLRAALTSTQSGTIPPGFLATFNVILFDDDSTPPNRDTAGNYNTGTGIYTAPSTEKYKLISRIYTTTPIPAGTYYLFMNITATSFYGASMVARDELSDGYYLETDWVDINSGDQIAVAFLNASASPQSYSVSADSYFEVKRAPSVQQGDTVNVAKLLHDRKQIDFVKGVMQMFNMCAYTNEATKQVIIEPRNTAVWGGVSFDGFFDDDIDNDLALFEDGALNVDNIEISFNESPAKYWFQYKEDSEDKYVEQIQNEDGLLMSGKFAMEDVGEEIDRKNFFAPTHLIYDTKISVPASVAGGDPPGKPVIIPRMWSAQWDLNDATYPEKAYQFEPRILLVDTLVDGMWYYWNGAVAVTIPQYNRGYMVDYFGASLLSIAWGNEVIDGEERVGLIQAFHLRQLASEWRGAIAKYKGFPKLSQYRKILLNDMRSMFKIYPLRWILRNIEGYDPDGRRETSFVFIGDVEPNTFHAAMIETAAIDGTINLEQKSNPNG